MLEGIATRLRVGNAATTNRVGSRTPPEMVTAPTRSAAARRALNY